MRPLFKRDKSVQTVPLVPVQAQIPELRDAELAAWYSGQRMAGDFYDFIRVGPDRVLFGLLDVAGRLEGNRAVISAAQETFRTFGADLFGQEEVNEAEAISELCLRLNRTVIAAEGGVRDCPAFAGCYNETLGTVCYFNAGHTSGLLRDNTGIVELPATSLPLGLFSHLTVEASMLALERGSSLLLVSQGAVDAKCGGEEFGLERVKANFQKMAFQNAKELCQAVLDQIQQFMCKPPRHNDVTALALVRTLPGAPSAG